MAFILAAMASVGLVDLLLGLVVVGLIVAVIWWLINQLTGRSDRE